MPPRRDPGFTFPPELTQLIQQQNTLMQLLVQNQNQGSNNNNPVGERSNFKKIPMHMQDHGDA